MLKNAMLPATEFQQRQHQLADQIDNNSVAILFAAKECTRSNDTEYLFCQNKHFYYLSGFNEPDAVMLLIKNDKSNIRTVMFCLDKDKLQEVWHGKRIGQQSAVEDYLFDESHVLSELDAKLPKFLENKSTLYYCQGEQAAHDVNVQKWLTRVKAQSRLGVTSPSTIKDLTPLVSEQRLIKSDAELSIMRQANEISAGAHQRAMKQTRAGVFEYQIEAEILHEFARHGARFAAYNSIVAGGDNANTLHYNANSDELCEGDLLLIDAGAELAGYAADITRTFPVNGSFSAPQKALYQLVLDAQELAISQIKPGNTLSALNKAVCDFFNKGLAELGILNGDVNQLISDNACKKYFIHGLGHWLGLDVHDVGDYHSNTKRQQLRPFEAGMVMTIEPGLYIPLDDKTVDAKWRGIAIRIEDNILVTSTGYENFSVNTPKTVSDIEALMAQI